MAQKITCDVASLKNKLASTLKKAREVSKLTEVDLAKAMETTVTGIKDIEKGESLVNFITVERWLEACGQEVHMVVTKKGESLSGIFRS